MKSIYFILSILIISISLYAQEDVKEASGPKITFNEEIIDFGDIHQGDKVEHNFVFSNTGDDYLIITNVQTTCGCTAPNWPKDPIAPGQTSEIKVIFNSAGKIGRQNKSITVISNATNSSAVVALVTNVLAKEDDIKDESDN